MATWADLEDELNLWRSAQVAPTLWWRDDDASAATAELEPLLQLSEKYHVPAHLAVIPDRLSPCLGDRLLGCGDVYLLQHGFAHINHEPSGSGASEFGDHRDVDLAAQDLQIGWQRLVSAKLPNLLPGFVPPWNRMSDAALARLPGMGYRLVSAYEGYTASLPFEGLIRVNGHVDPIRWKHQRRFRGTDSMLEMFTSHLAARREGRIDRAEPIGFLTHHLETSPDIWDFTDQLFDRMTHQGIAQWISLASLLVDKGSSKIRVKQ